jgi:hypothetical protein
MNYRKVREYTSVLLTERSNLDRQIRILEEQKTSIERRLKYIDNLIQLLGYVHQKTFNAALDGHTHAVIFLATSLPDKTGVKKWVSVHEAHESINKALIEVGIKGLHVESVDQFRIRCPFHDISSSEYDTVVSFPLSPE